MSNRPSQTGPAGLAALLFTTALAAACQGPAPAPAPEPAPAPAAVDPADAARQKRIARAKALELATPYEPPPGDALSHHTSGYVKTVCSAVFLTGYTAEFAAEHVGYFTGPYEHRAKVGKPVVDMAKKTVSITLPNGVVRTAVYTGGQGCVTYPEGSTTLNFTPKTVKPNLPPAASQDWPMGDREPKTPAPAGVDMEKMKAAVDAAFANPEAETTAFVVTYKGRIIAERYGDGITATTPLESWSMGKSVTGTIMGTLIHRGVYTLDQPAPVPEWQGEGDKRKEIRIQDIMRMSSGIRINAPNDPDYDPNGTYPDHLYLDTGGVDSYKYAATRPQQWPPNTVGRYRNTDPVLANYLNRLGIEKLKADYHSYPQRAVFDKLGIRTMVLETDPFGNFLTQGYEFMSGRDWARLGNLYLNDGVTPGGERILPEGYTAHVSTIAPAWLADENPVYGGGFFWVNGDGRAPLPKEAYSMQGAGGQSVWIVPSHDLVIVRLGNFKGSRQSGPTLNKAMEILVGAVPKR
ncbi:MAG: serine hydrolase [Acidobacteria bacterium]|nr:serine hydrolase [Acidobacteriota bacterium]